MKKHIAFMLILCLGISGFSQNIPTDIPEDIRETLYAIRENARIRLNEFRIGREGRLVYSNRLGYEFNLEEIQRIDSLGLELHIGMVFDQSMRQRILQLLEGGFEEYELDTLTNRTLNSNIRRRQYQAFDLCEFDTLETYKIFRDSLTLVFKKERPELSPAAYKHETMFHMRLDTTECFKTTFNQLNEDLRQWNRTYLLEGNRPTRMSFLAELAGHLGDSKFIEPLIAALDKPHKFQRQDVINALIRMRVEPYFSEYIEKNTFTLEEIKKGSYTDIAVMIDVWRTQEAFLELSKYLYSDVTHSVIMSDRGKHDFHITYAMEARTLLQNNLLNEDLHQLLNQLDLNKHQKEIIELIYEWMQNNYGNYEIKRIW